jgi:putative heme-binding domain-containing protein
MRLGIWLIIGTGLLGSILQSLCYAQERSSSRKIDRTAQSQPGQQMFAANCSGCHGLDGTGSQRAPNIVSNPQVEKLSPEALHRIISHGVPGTGMPAFQQLGASAISSLVSYVRSLQGNNDSTPLPGDPKHGEEVFFGSGQCATCHMVSGKGGFIGPDLTSYAQSRMPEKVKQAINDPTQRTSTRKVVTAITNDGEYHGIVVNEDNFSLQLQSVDGMFHFLMKSNLKAINTDQNSLMPSDYASRLSESQLNDLVSYLISVGRKSPRVKPERREDDE